MSCPVGPSVLLPHTCETLTALQGIPLAEIFENGVLHPVLAFVEKKFIIIVVVIIHVPSEHDVYIYTYIYIYIYKIIPPVSCTSVQATGTLL